MIRRIGRTKRGIICCIALILPLWLTHLGAYYLGWTDGHQTRVSAVEHDAIESRISTKIESMELEWRKENDR